MSRKKRKEVHLKKKRGSSAQAGKVNVDIETLPETVTPPFRVEPILDVASSNKPHQEDTYTAFRYNLYRFAKLWIKLLSAIASAIFLTTVLVAFGFNSWTPSPILDFVHLHLLLSIVAASTLAFISFFAWFFSRGSASENQKNDKKEATEARHRHDRNVLYATAISTISFIVCFILLSAIFLRPPWCPTLHCPAPKLILYPHSVHDNNLEVYFQAVQSPSYFIPDDPARYTLSTLPTETSVLRIDTSTQKPYRVVLGIHSLQQGRIGLIIDQVVLVVKQVTLVPYPLHIWIEGEKQNYHSNLYQVFYRGEETEARLLATYTPLNGARDGRVQLIPGESDELDIQVISRVEAYLHFQVQVTYRVINEAQEQTVTLPNLFEVIFSKASNWYPYHIQDGHLFPGP